MVKIFSDNPYWYSIGAFSHGIQVLEEDNEFFLINERRTIKKICNQKQRESELLWDGIGPAYVVFARNEKIVCPVYSIYDDDGAIISTVYDVEYFTFSEDTDSLKKEVKEYYNANDIMPIRYICDIDVCRPEGPHGAVFLCTDFSGHFSKKMEELDLDKLETYSIGPNLEGIICSNRLLWKEILMCVVGEKALKEL